MGSVSAETAYLFRHALVRSAAYELQLPGDRAELHALVVRLVIDWFGADDRTLAPFAAELCDHAGAGLLDRPGDDELLANEARLLPLAADDCHRLGNLEQARGFLRRMSGHERLDSPRRQGARLRCARLELQMGRVAEALSAARTVRADPQAGRLLALHAMAVESACLSVSGQNDLAAQIRQETLTELQSHPDAELQADLMIQTARDQSRAGQPEHALATLENCLAHCRAQSLEVQQVRVLGTLAGLHQMQERLDDAEAAYRQSLALSDKIGHRVYSATTRAALAMLERLRGNAETAEREFRAAVVDFQAMGHLENLVTVRNYLANLLRDNGRPEEALALHDANIALCHEFGWHDKLAMFEGNRGHALHALGRSDEAIRALAAATEMARRLGIVPTELINMNSLAATLQNVGREAEGEQLFVRCVALSRQAGDRAHLAQALYNLSCIFIEQGRLGRAKAALADAAAIERQGVAHSLSMRIRAEQSKLDLLTGADPTRVLERFADADESRAPSSTWLLHVATPRMHAALATEPTWTAVARETGTVADYIAARKLGDSREVRLARQYIDGFHQSPAGDAPLIFRGFSPGGLKPQLRLALLAHLQQHDPAAYAELVRHKALHDAMLEGTQGQPVPDWRDETPV